MRVRVRVLNIRPLSIITAAALATTATLSLSASSAHAASPIITDGDFLESNWSFQAHPYGEFGGSGAAERLADIGNPGFARRIYNNYGPSFSGSYNASFHTALTYNPSVGGPLTDLSFSIDSRYYDSLNALGFVIKQGEYTWGVGYFINGAAWETFTLTPVASDYFAYPFAPLVNTQPLTPDFSATGSPITFGFYTGNGSAGGLGETRSGLFDNFTVSFVPAPSAAAALVGAAALTQRRRRVR
jgi:hypothetical protein